MLLLLVTYNQSHRAGVKASLLWTRVEYFDMPTALLVDVDPTQHQTGSACQSLPEGQAHLEVSGSYLDTATQT